MQRARKKRTFIIIGLCSILLLMTVGYAAFSSVLTINTSSEITSSWGRETSETGTETVDVKGISVPVVTSGDGLYEDWTEPGRYIYRGANPDNYITFNGETAGWRIISIENDGTLKIIKNESIGNIAFDEPQKRDASTSTYCVNAATHGCNAWAATQNLVGNPSVFTVYYPNGNPETYTNTYSGTVIQDASLNKYLNEIYYNENVGTDKQYIQPHIFYVSSPGTSNDTESILLDSQQEKNTFGKEILD